MQLFSNKTFLHSDELCLQRFNLLVALLAETHQMRAPLLGRGHLRLPPAHGVLQAADLVLAVLKNGATLEQRSLLQSTRVGFSAIGPTQYLVQGRAKPVLHGPNSTEPNLFHHGETTYRVG